MDPKNEWRRSNPDFVVYVPNDEGGFDGDNEHFLVTETPGGDLLAVWTQSRVEGSGTNRLVYARSDDNAHWSQPTYLTGYLPGTSDRQASWGFPIVSQKGRIYIFYTRQADRHDLAGHCSGTIGCAYSDDDGHSWRHGQDIPFKRNEYDNPDPEVPPNWIVWQKPIRDSKGCYIAGYTQWTSVTRCKNTLNWVDHDSRAAFLRFENIDEAPDPQDLRLTWLPTNSHGLEVPHREYPHISVCQEPSLVLLPDGRLFTVTRTMTGYIYYSVSDDDGETWREPEVLRYRDGGEPVKHPMSPCPIYRLGDGSYLLIYHNNDGNKPGYSQFGGKWKFNQANFLRNPTYVSRGEFRPGAHQPIWFSSPHEFLDTGGVPIGPKGTAEIGTYPSLTEYKGKRVLWYPDRKYFLLGKIVSDSLLESLEVPR